MENRNAEYFYEAAKNAYNKKQKEKVLIYMEKLFDLFDKAAKHGEFSAEFEMLEDDDMILQIVTELKNLNFIVYNFGDKLRIEWAMH